MCAAFQEGFTCAADSTSLENIEPNATEVVARAAGCQEASSALLETRASDIDTWTLSDTLQIAVDRFAAVFKEMEFLDEPVMMAMLTESPRSPGEDMPSGDTRRRCLSGTVSDVLPDGTKVDESAMKDLLKDVLKPTEFSGQDRDWPTWAKGFQLQMSSLGLSEALRFAALRPSEITTMTPTLERVSPLAVSVSLSSV
jgi:hypothetical protein